MIALAAANSPRIHEMYTSLSSGIQVPAAMAGGGNWSLSDGGIAIGGDSKGRRRNDPDKKKGKLFCVLS